MRLGTVDWALRFDVAAFAGAHKVFFDAKGPAGTPEPRLGWTQMGTYTVEAAAHDAGVSMPDSALPMDGAVAPLDSGQPADGNDAGSMTSADASHLNPNPGGACGCAVASPASALPFAVGLLVAFVTIRRRR